MVRARRLPAGERRRRIIEVARSLFASAGYANVGTADLAKALASCGCSSAPWPSPTILRSRRR
jgi:AcrR family transcriptional regulator